MSGKRKTEPKVIATRVIAIVLVAAMLLGLVLSFLDVF